MALTQEQNQAWARQNGYTGTFGSGGFDAYLAANPSIAQAHTAWQAAVNGTPQTVAPAVPITTQMSNQVNNPELANGTNLAPVVQNVQSNELLNATPIAAQTPVTAAVTNTPVLPNAAQGQAATVDPNAAVAGVDPNGGQYQATTVSGQTPQAVAAQGEINPNATVQGQLANLYAQTENGKTPAWAQGSVNAAENAAAARGLGTSTIGTTALALATQQAALPIAAADASTYFQMDMANLTNRQQTNMANLQVRQQSLLSDQSALNAAAQFNASSEAQIQQFVSSLIAQISTQNADRTQAMSQFNAGETNKQSQLQAQLESSTGQFNTSQKNTIAQFNSNLQFQRDQFNANNQFAVDQSNALWRRAVNTANTAAINAANQTNVQNRYNMSQTAQNNLWQQFRDEAAWMFTASESERDRQYNVAMAANNRQYLEAQNEENNEPNYWNIAASAAGAYASTLFK